MRYVLPNDSPRRLDKDPQRELVQSPLGVTVLPAQVVKCLRHPLAEPLTEEPILILPRGRGCWSIWAPPARGSKNSERIPRFMGNLLKLGVRVNNAIEYRDKKRKEVYADFFVGKISFDKNRSGCGCVHFPGNANAT